MRIDRRTYATQDNVHATLALSLQDHLQVVQPRAVDEWHATHTDDPYLRVVVNRHHHLLKLIGNAKEKRSFYLIDLHS